MRLSRLHVAVFLSACLVGSAAAAQTAEEVVARNLEAKGGLDALKATTSVKMTGRISSPQGEMQMVTWAKRPNLVRRELIIGGQKMITGYDGTTVWMQQPGRPAQEMQGPQADSARTEAEFESLFVDYKQKGHTVEYVGKDTVNGRPVHHLKVTRKGGGVQEYYIDVETGLESRIRTAMTAPNGQRGTVDTELSDYRTIDGRVVPFKVRQTLSGAEQAEFAITFEQVEFNVVTDDAIFRMPAVK